VTKNEISGLMAIIISSIYLLATLRLPETAMGDNIGPKLFPILAGALAFLCGLILLVKDLRQKKSNKEIFHLGLKENKNIYIKIGITIFLGIAYGFALVPLGYVISTALFMLLVTRLINGPRWLENLLLALAFPVVTYVVFAIMLGLSLPRGLLSFLPF
jgi:putative tricarboxylic transport membrane protein